MILQKSFQYADAQTFLIVNIIHVKKYIIVESMILFFQDALINKVQRTVTSDKFNASLLIKSIIVLIFFFLTYTVFLLVLENIA